MKQKHLYLKFNLKIFFERSAFSDNFILKRNYTCQTKKQQFCRICEMTLTKLQSKTHINAQIKATLHRVEIR